MLKSRTFKNIEKAISLLSAYFLLAAQPAWADPAIIEDKLTQDPQNQGGFVDATKAEQSYQNQLTEVQRMQAQLNDPAVNNPTGDPTSIITKFQTPDQKTDQTLTQGTADATKVSQSLSTQKLNSQVDVAMLKMQLSPEVSPIFIEPTATAAATPSVPAPTSSTEAGANFEALQQVANQDQLASEQNKIKAVPIAEMGYTGTLVTNGQNSSTSTNQQDPTALAKQSSQTTTQTAQLTETQQSAPKTDSTAPSIESMISESPTLAGMTDGTAQPTAETAQQETQLASAAPTPTTAPETGSVAMEMAALMNVDTALAPSPTTQLMDVQSYSLMGALTPQMQVSSQATTTSTQQTTTPTLQDPPMFIFPIPEPTNPFVIPVQPAPLLPGQKPPANVRGGESLFGSLLTAIRSMLFADTNLGNGKVIGNGVNDKVEMLSKFMVMYFKFFGFNFNVNELRNLFLKGTTKDGMEIFGISEGDAEPVVPLVLLFSAYVLETSLFFPIKGAKGLSDTDLAGANKIQLPIIVPNELLISLGQFLNANSGNPNPNLTPAQANAAARAMITEAIFSFFEITLSVMIPTDGKPIKFFDPKHPDAEPFALGSNQTLNLQLPPDAIQFNFFKDLAPAVSASLLPLLQALNGTNTGMFGVLTIDLSSIMNQIGQYLVASLQDQLGPMLQYYNSLGSPTGLKPGLPVPSLPLLLMLGFNFPMGAGTTDPSLFSNPLFFAQTLAIPLLFALSTPPIPDIQLTNDKSYENYSKTFLSNAGDHFADQKAAAVAEKAGIPLSKLEQAKKPGKVKQKGKKK